MSRKIRKFFQIFFPAKLHLRPINCNVQAEMKSIYLQNSASHNNVNWIEVIWFLWFLGFDVEVEENPFQITQHSSAA